MSYEAIPAAVSNDPNLMRQFVLGQLPPTGSFSGRIINNQATNAADLVGWVEAGYLSLESIHDALGSTADGGAHDIGVAVVTALQDRHRATRAAAGAAQLEADNVGVASVLAGIDDPEAAVKHLQPKGKHAEPLDWHLHGDELYVRGVSCEQVAEALRLTRPAG